MTVVSIHTLHELEARTRKKATSCGSSRVFPFIRFTNWKQVTAIAKYTDIPASTINVSIHTLHELEARVIPLGMHWRKMAFPFIRFTNWKQVYCKKGTVIRFYKIGCFHSYASRIGSKIKRSSMTMAVLVVSIHTLHELEARNRHSGCYRPR